MKKLLLYIFIILGFTTLSARASTQVFYNNAGSPAFISHGYGPAYSYNNFGTNAAFSPVNTRNYHTYHRPYNHRYARPAHVARVRTPRPYYNCYGNYPNRRYYYAPVRRNYEIVSTPKTPETMSRFDKNYTASSNTKEVTCGGITYYGATNACR